MKVLLITGKRRYNIKLWKTFTDCFNCLPVAAIVDEKIFCCHGGLSPDLQSMEQIRRIMRPTDVPDQGLLCDLLWSDPDKVFIIILTVITLILYSSFSTLPLPKGRQNLRFLLRRAFDIHFLWFSSLLGCEVKRAFV